MYKVRKRVVSALLSAVMCISGIPVVNVAAANDGDFNIPAKVAKEDDPNYDPDFSYDEEYFDNVVAKSDGITDIGKLPGLDEFRELTGFVSETWVTLSEFRETYGTGDAFSVPDSDVSIVVSSVAELNLLSALVNNKAENETTAEQVYYSNGDYYLKNNIAYSGTTWDPIGTDEYPFNGSFDGETWEISNLKLVAANAGTYPITGSFGLFGVIGNGGSVKNLGIVSMTVNLPYTVAADAGFIAGINKGMIDNCYVNGKTSSRITISNATAGGICGENYGTIKRCYADAFISMESEESMYSEPQPITTVNHDGAVIDQCYYLKWTNLGTYANQVSVTAKTDTGNNSAAVGWAYKGDMSEIYGTGLSVNEFVSGNGMEGMTCTGGYLAVSEYTSGHSTAMRSVSEWYDIMGRGDNFNLYNNSACQSNGVILGIQTRKDWNLFCSLVNKEIPGETDAEQTYWSGQPVFLYGNAKTNNMRSLTLYADDKALGTNEHPYRGIFYGENVMMRKELSWAPDGDHVARPVFGVINNRVENLYVAFTGNACAAEYLEQPFLCQTNNGTFDYITCFGSSFPFTDTTDYEIAIYSDDPRYAEIKENKMESGYKPFYIFGDNNGEIESISVASDFCIYSGTKDDPGACTDRYLIGYLKGNTGTLSGWNNTEVYSMDGNKYSSGIPSATRYAVWQYDYRASFSMTKSTNRSNDPWWWTWERTNVMSINKYPSTGAPHKNDDGVYLVYTPREYIWLLTYAVRGSKAKLMNTIDMTNHPFIGGSPFNGDFSMDGTLVDETDVCNNIDLGVTKCYGIVNLQIKNRALAAVGKTSYKNVYFIGGYIMNEVDQPMDTTFLANSINSCHTSIDIIMGHLGWDSRWNCAQTGYAVNSSISGRYICTTPRHCQGFSALATTCKDCVCYTQVGITSTAAGNNNNNMWFMGRNVDHCLNRVSVIEESSLYDKSLYKWESSQIRFGDVVTNSRFDKTLDLTNGVKLSCIMGNTVTDCTVTGSIINGHISNGRYGFAYNATNLVCTEQSSFSGNIQGITTGDSNHILLKGQVDVWVASSSQCIANGSNIYVDNVINIHASENLVDYTNNDYIKSAGYTKKDTTNGSLVCLGANQNCYFNGDLKFLGFDTKAYYPNWQMIVVNSGVNSRIYKDVDITGKMFLSRFTLWGSPNNNCYNYANITTDDEVSFVQFGLMDYTGNSGTQSIGDNLINFGDVEIHGCSNVLHIMYLGNWRPGSNGKNYGNITYDNTSGVRIPQYVYIMHGVHDYNGFSYVVDNNINYGDIFFDGHNKDTEYYIRDFDIAYGGSNYGNVTIKNLATGITMKAASYNNYGNIYIENINGTLCVYGVYSPNAGSGGVRKSFGDVTFKNITTSGAKVAYYPSNHIDYTNGTTYSVTYLNKGTVTIENVKTTNVQYDSQRIEFAAFHPEAGRYNTTFDDVCNLDSRISWNLKNVDTNYDFCATAGTISVCGKDKGYKHISGEMNIDGLSCRNAYITGVGIYGAGNDHEEWVNTANIDVSGLKVSNTANISGGTTNMSNDAVNLYNFGDINVKTDTSTNTGTIIVTGCAVANGANTVSNDKPHIVANFGNISVTSNVRSFVDGCIYGTYNLQNRMYNLINAGNIDVTMTNDSPAYISGIADQIGDGTSFENYGNITVVGAKDGNILAIGRNKGKIKSCVNYGDVTVNDDFAGNCGFVYNTTEDCEAKYLINYGTFNKAGLTSAGGVVYAVDFSGNKNIMPAGCSFTTDPTETGTTLTIGRSYNDLEYAVKNPADMPDETYVSKKISYADAIKPEFGLRYNNIISPEYTTVTTKKWYNAENAFEYADSADVYGKLSDFVNDHYNANGGFVLCASDNSGTGQLGINIEDMFYRNSTKTEENAYDWWSDYKVGEETFKSYLENTLTQRVVSTVPEVYDVMLHSDIEYETKGGDSSIIGSKSNLVSFQAPVDGNADGVYSDTTIVSVVDVYIAANMYKNIIGSDINWAFDVVKTRGSSLALFNEPIVCTDADDMIDKINELNAIPDTGADTCSIKVADIGMASYVLAGVLVSEDGKRNNIIAVKLNSITTDPLGWMTRFSYPKAYGQPGDVELPLSENFFADEYYYDMDNRFEVYEDDMYTVEKATPELENFEDAKYPVYTMTENMIHLADGGWGSTYQGQYYNFIKTTGNLILKFRTQNIDKYRIDIDAEGYNTFSYTGNCPVEGVASKDGTRTIKDNTVSIKDVKFVDSEGNEMTLSKENKGINNPFYTADTKIITVYGFTESEDIVPIIKIKVDKNLSFENYLKIRDNRDSYFRADTDSNVVSNKQLGLDSFFIPYFKGIDLSTVGLHHSTESTLSDERFEVGSFVVHGESTYPEYVKSEIDVTAQNGDVHTYSYKEVFPAITTLNWSATDSDSINNGSYRDGIWFMEGAANSFYLRRNFDDNVFDGGYNDLSKVGMSSREHWNVEKVEVLVDGEHYGWMTIGDDKVSAYFSEFAVGFKLDNSYYRPVVYRDDVSKDNLPDGVIAIRPYISYKLESGKMQLRMTDFLFEKSLAKDHQLIRAKLSDTIAEQYITDVLDDETENVESGSDGYITYHKDYKEIEHLYVYDTVDRTRTSSIATYTISPGATLQKYENDSWVNVFTATVTNGTYNTTLPYDILSGGRVTYKYRVLAQAYDADDETAATYVSYFDHIIMASKRNKKLSIEFKNDAETMGIYNEIIGEYGNLSVQVKNMNIDEMIYQQTKIYTGPESLTSTYYNLAQGSYAVLVHLPKGYSYNVRLIGSSSEGYLIDMGNTSGKRLRLPYPNEQVLRMEITLTKDISTNWGVIDKGSLFGSNRINYT